MQVILQLCKILFGENWVMGIQKLSVLFLASACEFTIKTKRKINAG